MSNSQPDSTTEALFAALASSTTETTLVKRPGTVKRTRFPSEWKYRTAFVKGQALPLEVPRHIVRIDIDTPGRGRTHGWQVRYQREGSRFFSDSLADRRGRLGTPEDSLELAKRYLKDIWEGPRLAPLRPERASKHHPTGMAGVRVVWRVHRNMNQCSVRVDDLKGKPIANLYVGTEKTFRDFVLTLKIREGRRIRLDYLRDAGMLHRLQC